MSARMLLVALGVVLLAMGATALTPVERAVIWTQVWNQVAERFVGFDSTARGMTRAAWEAGFATTLNRLVDARTDVEFWRGLRMKLAELNDGQTRLNFPPGLPREYDTVPMRLITAGSSVFVKAVSNSPEIKASRVRVGDELVSVEGEPVRVWIERECFPHVSGSTYFGRYARAADRALTGKAGSVGRFGFVRPDGSEYEVKLLRSTGERWEYWDELFSDSLIHSRLIEGRYLFLDFGSRLTANAESLALRLLDQHADAKAVILDLRETGSGQLPRQLLSRLAFFPLPIGPYREVRSRLVRGAEGSFVYEFESVAVPEEYIEPQSSVFRGDVLALVSPATSGVAEQFLQPLVFASRVVLVGSPTAGAGGQVYAMNLGSGASLSINVREPDWEGGYGHRCGFPPGIFASPTAHGLAAGRDEVLDAALEYLHNKPK